MTEDERNKANPMEKLRRRYKFLNDLCIEPQIEVISHPYIGYGLQRVSETVSTPDNTQKEYMHTPLNYRFS
jgi:hypothetical protein